MATKQTGNSPDTVAWRLSAVEKEVKELKHDLKSSTDRLETKLDSIASGFATHKDIEVAKEQAQREHDAIYEKIDNVETDVLALRSKTWVHNTLSAILGAILTLLLAYFINTVGR